MIHIDCTMRDGGYYNQWDFPLPVVEAYLKAMQRCGIHHVEIGFRFAAKNGFLGACAYSTDRFLRSLDVPDKLILGVMVNVSDLVTVEAVPEKLDQLFSKKDESLVSMVRLASHFEELEIAVAASNYLQELGYSTGINLMQISERTNEELVQFGKLVANTNIDVAYFADSLGSLQVADISNIISKIREFWKGPLGIHAHDNLGLALQNSLEAIKNGATWVDSTITGMGRGPGNTQTEFLIHEVGDKIEERDPSLLFDLIDDYFLPRKAECGWGMNTYYYMAGKSGIHPTYVQNMLADNRYENSAIMSALSHLRKVCATRYSDDILSDGLNAGISNDRDSNWGNWSPENDLFGEELLIIGAGPSANNYRKAIESLILEKQLKVIVLNTITPIDEKYIFARIACHPSRILTDLPMYKENKTKIILPMNQIQDSLMLEVSSLNVANYELLVEQGKFEVRKTSATIPSQLAIAYALAVASSAKASRIYLAGFDGYEMDDPRFLETANVFRAFQAMQDNPSLTSITPTAYELLTKSVYVV